MNTALCFLEVILPSSTAQIIGFKLTCDAARLMRAPKAYKVCTTCILQMLCYSRKRGDWGDMVTHMVSLPQSCKRAFKTRLWFGKDNAPNVSARFTHNEGC